MFLISIHNFEFITNSNFNLVCKIRSIYCKHAENRKSQDKIRLKPSALMYIFKNWKAVRSSIS